MGTQLLLQQSGQVDHIVPMRRPSGLVPAIKLFMVFGYEKDRDCPQVGAPDEAAEEAGGSWAFPSHFFRKVEES